MASVVALVKLASRRKRQASTGPFRLFLRHVRWPAWLSNLSVSQTVGPCGVVRLTGQELIFAFLRDLLR